MQVLAGSIYNGRGDLNWTASDCGTVDFSRCPRERMTADALRIGRLLQHRSCWGVCGGTGWAGLEPALAGPPTLRRLRHPLRLASGCVRSLCQFAQEREERGRLAAEQPVVRQCHDRTHRGPFGRGGTNDRNDRELAVQKDRWLGHDQVGLEILPTERRGIEVWELQSIGGGGYGRRIAGLVLPGLEVLGLGRANAEQDAQHLGMGDPLRQGGIEARAPLLDEREMEPCRVGDRLQMARGLINGAPRSVRIILGDRPKPASSQTRNGLSKRFTELRILRPPALPRPPPTAPPDLHLVAFPFLPPLTYR